MEESQAESTSLDPTQAVTEEVEETSTTDDTSTEEEATNDESQEDESNESESEDESQEDESEDDDEEALVPLSKLRKVRSEAKNLRERLKAAEGKIEELQSVNPGEVLQTRYDELVCEVRNERLEHIVQTEVANTIDPSAISKLIRIEDVTWEDNQPSNVQELVSSLKTAHPKLFQVSVQGTTNAGARDEEIDLNSLNLSPQQRIAVGLKNSSR